MFGSWNWTGAILLLCLYPVLFVMYFILENEVKPGKNVILHVTFSYADLADPQLRQICGTFKKKLKRALWILAALPLPGLFLTHVSLAAAVLLNWLIPVLLWPGFLCVRCRKKLLARKRELASDRPGDPQDEDLCWIGGIFYYNPDDPYILKGPGRGSAFNSTVNLARPLGKVLAVFGLVGLLILPFSSLYMVGEEFMPLTCRLENETITVRHVWQECRIPLSEIEEMQVLCELPALRRVWGSSIGEVRKGKFRVEGYGDCMLYLQSQEGPFLLLRTEDTTYLLPWEQELAKVWQARQ
ncbi:MAG: hypothetical protein HFI39_06415 [Lachnospiraceae bacterium]|nr:hypothetical protein [Lachnospiraceae bacterium]